MSTKFFLVLHGYFYVIIFAVTCFFIYIYILIFRRTTWHVELHYVEFRWIIYTINLIGRLFLFFFQLFWILLFRFTSIVLLNQICNYLTILLLVYEIDLSHELTRWIILALAFNCKAFDAFVYLITFTRIVVMPGN